MAINSFSHAVLSASLVSYPELAEGSGYAATGSVSNAVSLTAGTEVHTPGRDTGIGTRKSALSGVIGLRKLGAIGEHPVSQLLYTPPPRTNGHVPQPVPIGGDGTEGFPVNPVTNEAAGRSNLIAYQTGAKQGAQCVAEYRLVSPEGTETVSFHRPHLKHAGDTFISSSLSGITVALRTSPSEAGKSRHQIHDHPHSGIEVQYYLPDPGAGAGSALTVVSAGLSSKHSGFVGPEHSRKRLLGY